MWVHEAPCLGACALSCELCRVVKEASLRLGSGHNRAPGSLMARAACQQVCEGVEATAYYAGHTLGAAMIHVRVGCESLVYTGATVCSGLGLTCAALLLLPHMTCSFNQTAHLARLNSNNPTQATSTRCQSATWRVRALSGCTPTCSSQSLPMLPRCAPTGARGRRGCSPRCACGDTVLAACSFCGLSSRTSRVVKRIPRPACRMPHKRRSTAPCRPAARFSSLSQLWGARRSCSCCCTSTGSARSLR